MKKLIIILSILLLFSCTPDPLEVITPIEPEESQLIGTWTRRHLAWDFTSLGEFTYYDWEVPEIFNHGFYLDDPEQGIFYVEDYFNGEYMYYLYSVSADGITLLMAPEFAPGNFGEWRKVK